MLTNNNIIFIVKYNNQNDVVDEMILKLNGEADNTTLIKCSEYVIKVAHSLIITTKYTYSDKWSWKTILCVVDRITKTPNKICYLYMIKKTKKLKRPFILWISVIWRIQDIIKCISGFTLKQLVQICVSYMDYRPFWFYIAMPRAIIVVVLLLTVVIISKKNKLYHTQHNKK
jgi:hypothetical protein